MSKLFDKSRLDPILASDWNAIPEGVASALNRGAFLGRVGSVLFKVLATADLPVGFSQFTNCRYWCRPLAALNSGDSDNAITTTVSMADIAGGNVLMVTNLEESTSHNLPDDFVIEAHRIVDGDGRARWVCREVRAVESTISIVTATGSSWPRTYTAKIWYKGAEVGSAKDARNLAETDYTNSAIANSYRAMQVGDRVSAWWNNTGDRWEFREFRLLNTQAC